MRFLRNLRVLTFVVGAILLAFGGFALSGASAAPAANAKAAAPKAALWRGWCGGPATSGPQMLSRMLNYDIRSQLESYYGIDNVNMTLESFFADVKMATLARPMAQTDNRGCNPGQLFDAQNRLKKPGDRMAVRGRDLRAKFPDGYSLAPKPGWRRHMVRLNTLGQADCSNPGRGPGWFWVWTPPVRTFVPPKPKKASITIFKIALDVQGHQLPATPTGTFRFKVQCGLNGEPRYYVYNHVPQSAGTCSVGSRARVWELKPLGNEEWKILTPVYQTMPVGKKGARFVYKNQEAGPLPAPKAMVVVQKICEDANGSQLAACPTNTFSFTVTTNLDGKWTVTYNPEIGKDYMIVGQCTVGSQVIMSENVPNGWKTADGVPNPQVLPCAAAGVRFVFKNLQLRPSVTVTTTVVTTTPPTKVGTPGAGSSTPGTPGGSGSVGTPGTGSGAVCRDPGTGNIRSGNPDQFGYCV